MKHVLKLIAVVIGVSGLAINGWFAMELGSNTVAGILFVAIGISADMAAFILPTQAGILWRNRQRVTAITAWAIWGFTFAFALIASVGFASLNIADVTTARANKTSPQVEVALKALTDAKGARDRECKKVGPICRQREDAVRDRQTELTDAMTKVAAVADPQTQGAAKLVAWATMGAVTPSANNLADVRLALLTILPQLGGLILMAASSGETVEPKKVATKRRKAQPKKKRTPKVVAAPIPPSSSNTVQFHRQ